VDQIQATHVAKPDNILNNYEPPAESFSMQLFQVAQAGEWIFVSFLMDHQASIRRASNRERSDPSGRIENAKNLGLAECCNAVLKIFASDSKYLGNALLVFRAGQLFGESAQEFRWVADLLLDHPTRIRIAVVDWNSTIAKEGNSLLLFFTFSLPFLPLIFPLFSSLFSLFSYLFFSSFSPFLQLLLLTI
jgi:hypothetical protein